MQKRVSHHFTPALVVAFVSFSIIVMVTGCVSGEPKVGAPNPQHQTTVTHTNTPPSNTPPLRTPTTTYPATRPNPTQYRTATPRYQLATPRYQVATPRYQVAIPRYQRVTPKHISPLREIWVPVPQKITDEELNAMKIALSLQNNLIGFALRTNVLPSETTTLSAITNIICEEIVRLEENTKVQPRGAGIWIGASSAVYTSLADVVYITRTGKKYHRWGCRYLHSSAIPIHKPNAIAGGYTPCEVCKP